MIYGNKFKNGFNIEEILNEITIYKGDGILITVDGSGQTDRNFDKDPYFKVYNNESSKRATKIARISCKTFKQIYHTDNFDDWDLNKKDKKKIANILNNKKSTSKDFSVYNSVWDAMQEAIKQQTNGKFDPNTDYIKFPGI